MTIHIDQIEKIIEEGVKNNLDEKDILNQVLKVMADIRKSEHIPVKEYEESLKRFIDRIKQLRQPAF